MPSPPPPRDIPGYYYDTSKGKYFRITPNHHSPSTSSAAAKYTKQAVETSKRHDDEHRTKQRRLDTQREQRVRRDKFVTHPVLGLDLSMRLGVARKAVGDGIRRQYAYMLRPQVVMDYGKPGQKFAIDPVSKALFTTAAVDGRWHSGREMCVTPLSRSRGTSNARSLSSTAVGDADENEEGKYPKYDPGCTIPILNANDASAILPLSESTVVWSSLRHEQGGEASNLYFSRKYASDSVPWQNWREEFGEWGTTVHQLQSVVWDIAAPRVDVSGLGGEGGSIVLATGGGIKVCHVEPSGRGLRDVRSLEGEGARRAYMAVRFKDANVFMGGGREGKVLFGDLRVKSSVVRLGHRSGVSGLRRMRNENQVLVNGLEGMSAYDLRFVKGPVELFWREYWKDHFATVLRDFDVPENMQQWRYGLGFDYDEELNIAVSASTNFKTNNKVGLWDCGSGQRIEVGSLVTRAFKDPVTCLRIADLRGRGSSAKNILTMSDGVIEEWSV